MVTIFRNPVDQEHVPAMYLTVHIHDHIRLAGRQVDRISYNHVVRASLSERKDATVYFQVKSHIRGISAWGSG